MTCTDVWRRRASSALSSMEGGEPLATHYVGLPSPGRLGSTRPTETGPATQPTEPATRRTIADGRADRGGPARASEWPEPASVTPL